MTRETFPEQSDLALGRALVETDEPVGFVHVNPTEIEQVLVNVIRNAVESRPTGATVHIGCMRIGNHIEIEVADDGRGISSDAQKHIFDPFYTDRRSDGGTGLGLSVSYGIISDHDGQISMHSGPEPGTRVIIELPVVAHSRSSLA